MGFTALQPNHVGALSPGVTLTICHAAARMGRPIRAERAESLSPGMLFAFQRSAENLSMRGHLTGTTPDGTHQSSNRDPARHKWSGSTGFGLPTGRYCSLLLFWCLTAYGPQYASPSVCFSDRSSQNLPVSFPPPSCHSPPTHSGPYKTNSST